MAVKKSRPLDDPPAASSEEEVESEEEEEQEEEETLKPQSKESVESEDVSEEEEEESDDEDEEKKKISTPPAKLKKNPLPESSSESGSGKSPRASDFTIKPISAIIDEVTKPSPAKRRAENGKSAAKSKKAKTEVAGAGEESEKKSAINRLWSEEDEIRILKGVLEFQSKKGKDVSTHQQEFHDFVKGSIHVDVSKSQLTDKVRRLKRKYKTNLERSNNGEDPSFSKPHELNSFKLSKKIWGGGEKNSGLDDSSTVEKPAKSGAKKSGSEKPKATVTIEPKEEEKLKDLLKVKPEKADEYETDDDLDNLYPSLMNACEPDHTTVMTLPEFLKSNLSLIGSSQLKDLDSKWKRQSLDEMEVFLGRIDLLREEAQMVLDAMKSNED